MLMQQPTEDEIKESICMLHPLKSLGRDGFLGIFLRNYWETVKGKVVNFVQCFRKGTFPSSVNKTFIVHITKTPQVVCFDHFRPINLCNFSYKIVENILGTRLSKIMDRVISPNQRAFVKGRWLAENAVIAQEVVHKIKKHQRVNDDEIEYKESL